MIVAGCATGAGDRGMSLAGQTIRMETMRGDVTLLRFRGDSRVRAEFAGRAVQGRWRLDDGRLCFFWTGAPRECWPYARPLARGESRRLTSDRGNAIRITRL